MPYKRFFLAAAALVTACGGASEPKVGPPAVMSVVTAPTSSVPAAGAAGTFTVKVSDAGGSAVSGATVAFSVSNGGTAAPTTAITDASGVAQTSVTAGTLAGAATVTGTVSGTSVSAVGSITVTPGPIAILVVAPKTLKFYYVGDSMQLSASAADKYNNALPISSLTFAASDPTLVSVSAAGVLKVLRNGGSTNVTIASGTISDFVAVTVGAAGTTPCTGVAASTTMALGDVIQFQGANNGCVRGDVGGAEYAVVAYNSSASTLAAGIRADGAGSPPATSVLAATDPTAFRGMTGGPTAAVVPDVDFHYALQQRMHRDLPQYAAAARAMYRAKGGRLAPSLSLAGTSPSASSIPGTVAVGDIVTVNVNPNSSCTTPQNHPARVGAVGTKSIVLVDTLNPTGGFTDADLQKFAARFDTLVYPLDTDAFGVPSDIDGNGRVLILFTRSVNELTPAGSNSFVGGFFYGRDLYPKVAAPPLQACTTSNQAEMFYLLVPDTGGVINGNKRSVAFVDGLTTGVIAHEFQHLINSSRRLFVNNAPDVDEIIWLNEGLSHIAEELLYYRESGKTPRQNLDDAAIRTQNPGIYGFWKTDASSNTSRFLSYLRAPSANTPTDENPDGPLAARGATWSFLRYAADRLYAQDGTVWQKFDNSTTSGLNTLQSVYGTDPQPLLRDWNVANYVDDLGITADAKYKHASWNFRDIYTKTYLNIPTYPLVLVPVPDQRDVSTAVRAGSAAYMRMSVPAGREALLTFSSNGSAPAAQLQYVVVRTK